MDPITMGIISLIVGTLIGGIVAGVDINREYTTIEDEKKHFEEEYAKSEEEDKAAIQKSFELEKANAKKQATRADETTTVNEKAATAQANVQIDQTASNQLQSLFQENTATNQLRRETGNALSQNAASGTRAGGSVSQAIELDTIASENSLQMQQDITRRNNDNQVNSLLASLAQSRNSIQNQRNEANDLRLAYEKGGLAYEKNELNKSNITLEYDRKRRTLEYEYTKKKNELEDPLYFMTKAFGAANSGTSLSNSILKLFPKENT